MTIDFDKKRYSVGGLLYTPALNTTISKKIIDRSIEGLTSVALCLEDSVEDAALESAEKQLMVTLNELRKINSDLPMIFVRIRTPEHMLRIHNKLGELESVLTGYILPKFDLTNAAEYCDIICRINDQSSNDMYIMPILESRTVANIQNRVTEMQEIKNILDSIYHYVLNVRVGGNDFCNMYGIRRSIDQNIYQIGVIRDILVGIINVFANDYVVSGPVWEYFGDNSDLKWADGLRKEIKLDLLNGFVGKTAIHPSQLTVIREELRVDRSDYQDAKNIADWQNEDYAVGRSVYGDRMNEVKTHYKWAKKILALAEIYGING